MPKVQSCVKWPLIILIEPACEQTAGKFPIPVGEPRQKIIVIIKMYHLKSDSFLLLCIIYESGSSLCQLKSLRENDSPQIYCVGEVEKSRARQPQKMQATFAGWVWVCFYVTDLISRPCDFI